MRRTEITGRADSDESPVLDSERGPSSSSVRRGLPPSPQKGSEAVSRIPRTSRVLAAASAAALLASGCSDSSDDGGSAAGEPIPIMVFGSFTQPPYILPEIVTGAQAAVDRINADGGVNGRELELIECDDNGNPNDAAACGRQAVDEDVAAVVGTFTLFGDSVVPLLERANIPYLLPTAISTTELTSPVSFPVQDGSLITAAVGGALQPEACGNVATMATDFDQSYSNFEEFWEPAIRGFGATEVNAVYVPAAATDMAPFVAQASSAGAECLAVVTGAQQTAAVIRETRASGSQARVATTSLGLPESVLEQLGEDGNGVLAVSPFFLPSTDEPVAVQAAEDIAEVDAEAPVNDAALNAYAAVLVFAEVADGLEEVTGEAVLKALDSAGPIDVGLFAPVDFGDGSFLPSVPRLAQSVFQVYVGEDGRYVPSDQPAIDLRTAYNGN
ncbi:MULTISPECIES: ABC transporter substrate-binding protein [unclassified Modestobacter]